MASGFVSDFNVTDASNTSFAGISQAENVMLPSNVNDDFRAKDGAFARWLNDLGSTATVGGTANAITVTLAQPFTAYGSSAGQIPNGAIIAIKPTAANTGAVAIVVNSLTSKAIRAEGDVALIGGELAANGAYLLKYDTAYNSAAGAWVLLNPSSTYVEGTFTPRVDGSTSAGTGTYSQQVGKYTRIRNLIRFSINIQWSAHTGTGNVLVRGLPFVSANDGLETPVSSAYGGGVIFTGAPSAWVEPNGTQVSPVQTSFTTGGASFIAITGTGTIYLQGTYTLT